MPAVITRCRVCAQTFEYDDPCPSKIRQTCDACDPRQPLTLSLTAEELRELVDTLSHRRCVAAAKIVGRDQHEAPAWQTTLRLTESLQETIKRAHRAVVEGREVRFEVTR